MTRQEKTSSFGDEDMDPWAESRGEEIDHWAEALKSSRKAEYDISVLHEGPDTKEQMLAEAQVHATLAVHHDLTIIAECLQAMIPS